jgi:hypothetical protein
MGYLSPFLNEDLARIHSADLQSLAQRHHQVRAARAARPPRARRWKSGLGRALLGAGLALLSQTPDRSRRRTSTSTTMGEVRPLSRVVTTTFCPCGCDG